MDYFEIFDDVVKTMRTDSATCRDIPGADPAPFREKIAADMPQEDFVRLMTEYLLSFGFYGHLSFGVDDPSVRRGSPIRVMRYQDALYVIAAVEGSGFQAGDRITALNGMTIEKAAEQYALFLPESVPERQCLYWWLILRMLVDECTVERYGCDAPFTVPFRLTEKGFPEREFVCRALSDGTVYLCLPHFSKHGCVEELLRKNRKLMRGCRDLIIDVRGNTGGNSGEYHCLFPYCYPAGKNAVPLWKNYESESNYTVYNSDNKYEMARAFGLSEKQLRRYRENRGKGFVREGSQKDDIIRGRKQPERVFVLCDSDSASAGENLVGDMAFSPKVTVIGRPTAGANDYTDLCQKRYGNMLFAYPYRRSLLIDRGEGKMGRGEPVDIYIPWTPAHFGRDPELEKAEELIRAAR